MANEAEHMQRAGKDQLENAFASSSHITEGFQRVFKESIDYSKRSVEHTVAFTERLMGVRSVEKAIQLQVDFVRTQTEGFIEQMTKIGSIYRDIAVQGYKPVESAVEKGKEFVQH